MNIHMDTWMASLTIPERGLVLLAGFSVYFGIPLLLVLIFHRKSTDKGETYGTYLAILTGILFLVWLLSLVLMLLSFVLMLLSGLVMWIIGNLMIIAIAGVSVFFLLTLLTAWSSNDYGAVGDRTHSIIVACITAALLVVMILWARGAFSTLKGMSVAIPLITTVVSLFVVVALIQALSSSYGKRQRWWLLSALLATVVAGILLPTVIDQFLPGRPHVEDVSLSYVQFYLYGSVVGVLLLPAQVGRALYKVFYGDDVTVTHTRKPREQHQYSNAGYRCGRCGHSLDAPAPQCPHCGVRFGGQQEEYLPGTPPPKPTKTTTRNTTPLAGVFVLLLLILDMLYGVSMFEITGRLSLSDHAYQIYVVGAPIANLIVIVVALLLVRRYARVNGSIEKTSYY